MTERPPLHGGSAAGPTRRLLLGSLGGAGLAMSDSAGRTAAVAQPASSEAPAPQRRSPGQEPVLMLGTDMHVGAVRALAVSSDGTLLATGSSDKTIRLWQAATGRELARLHLPVGPGSVGTVDSLAFAPDARRLFAGGIDWMHEPGRPPNGVAYVFDLATARLTGAAGWASDFGARLSSLAVSPDGSRIAIAAGRRGLLVRSTAAPLFEGSYVDPPSRAPADESTLAVAFSPDGRLLAATGGGGLLRLFAVGADGGIRLLETRRLAGGGVFGSLAFSADAARVAVGQADGSAVHIVPVRPGAAASVLKPPPALSRGNLFAATWCRGADGAEWLLAAGTVVNAAGRNTVLAWREGVAASVQTLQLGTDSVTALARRPDGGAFFATSDPGWGQVSPGMERGAPGSVSMKGGQQLDFRGVALRAWGIDATGSRVEFQGAGNARFLFDLRELALTLGAAPLPGLSRPRPVPDRAVMPVALGFQAGTLMRCQDRSAAGDLVVSGTDDELVLGAGPGGAVVRHGVVAPVWAVALSADATVAVAAHGDGTVRWYRIGPARQLTELGGLFTTVDGQRWVAWRRDGRFAHGAQGGSELVGFLQNGTFQPGQMGRGDMTPTWFDVTQLYGRLYDPRAVQAMLRTGTEPSLTRAVLDDVQLPGIELASICPAGTAGAGTRACTTAARDAARSGQVVTLPDGSDRIRAGLRVSLPGAATQLAVFVNGRSVTRSLVQPVAGNDGALEVSREVPLDPGENRIEFRAYGPDRRSFSRAPVIVRTGGSAAAAARPTLHTVVAGIDRYHDSIGPLFFAGADAASFADVVRTRPAAAYDVAPFQPLFDADATRDAIVEQLRRVASVARPEDTVVVYLSGHGVIGQSGSYSFVTADEVDAAAVRAGGRGLTAEMLAEELSRCRARRSFVFLDTCHAAGFDPRAIGYLDQAMGRYVLAATAEVEVAADAIDGRNGLFAYALLEGLRGGILAPGGTIDALDLGRFVTDRVQELAEERSLQQRAIFLHSGRISGFPLFSA